MLAVLAFDMSNSIEGEKLMALRAASQALLGSLRRDDEATLFTFADAVHWRVRPTTDKAAVRQALEYPRPGGATPLMDALYAAVTLPRTRGRTLVVLFTDGADNSSWLDWGQVQLVAERSNTLIHLVSLRPREAGARPSERGDFGTINAPGESAAGRALRQVDQVTGGRAALEFEDSWALRQIAEATGGRYWEAESLDRLKTAFAAIAEAMARRYVLRYVPENVTRQGWHKIELRLRGKKGEVHTRKGYWVAAR